ncbi:arabinogalactan endo-beta-1,4-galactanase [Salipaludibacillus sp. HK11]|uniref:glycoside hydrolase family 53 protein n=1 Tax=Salipaludibacillus sp. HK11 TaxID=3394320 RepID=UPI0039FC64F6
MKWFISRFVVNVILLVCLLFELFFPSQAFSAGVQEKGLNSSLIMGGDVSMLQEVEERGAEFFENGVQKDALEIMSNGGMDLVRLRLWVDPYDSEGNDYGGGTNDLEETIALARRAKTEGMGFMLNFHYSDFWADPGKQNKPKAWEELSYEVLVQTVYDYTKNTMIQLEGEGLIPDMVQIGNEITSGMLWNHGRVGDGYGDFTQLAELLMAGINGIHDGIRNSENVEIVLHLDHGGDNQLYRWWFDEITEQGVEFDIIGLSYYPFWHGAMGELKYNLNDISRRYDKDVMVVETSYGFTLEDGDGLGNSFYTEEEAIGGYGASVQGQMNFLRDLKAIVAEVPEQRGRGVIWWEPAWLPVEGANWGSEAGATYNNDTGLLSNPWDNQTLFDFDGNVLETLSVFGEGMRENLVYNPSFEMDDWTNEPSGWGVWSANSNDYHAIFTERPGVVGDYKLTHWKDTAYTVSTYQVLTGLEDGLYSFSAWILNSGGQDSVYMYAKNYGGSELQIDLPVSPEIWTKVSIENIEVINGQCEIGVISYANEGTWMNFDGVSFIRND